MPFVPSYPVPPERRAYHLPGGPVGVLFLHGYMGSPISSRPLAEHLAERNITVACPLLPGHGNLPNKIRSLNRRVWLAEAEEAYQTMRAQCRTIFVFGHSMGGVLAAHIAERFEVAGIVLLAPLYEVPDRKIRLLRFGRYFLPWINTLRLSRMRPIMRDRVMDFDPTIDLDDPAIQKELPRMVRLYTSGIDEMRKMGDYGRRLWPRLQAPILVMQGGHDVAVTPGNTEKLFAALTSPAKELAQYPDGGHELIRLFDPTHPEVWARIDDFIERYSAASS